MDTAHQRVLAVATVIALGAAFALFFAGENIVAPFGRALTPDEISAKANLALASNFAFGFAMLAGVGWIVLGGVQRQHARTQAFVRDENLILERRLLAAFAAQTSASPQVPDRSVTPNTPDKQASADKSHES
ncbi:hypothetical protein [Humidisolicoccus flavus]|uniref:hypothetical protein n=1 Tax=Humidisolicoccus flavus TaxID=3111414 RepID=UPI0032561A2E